MLKAIHGSFLPTHLPEEPFYQSLFLLTCLHLQPVPWIGTGNGYGIFPICLEIKHNGIHVFNRYVGNPGGLHPMIVCYNLDAILSPQQQNIAGCMAKSPFVTTPAIGVYYNLFEKGVSLKL